MVDGPNSTPNKRASARDAHASMLDTMAALQRVVSDVADTTSVAAATHTLLSSAQAHLGWTHGAFFRMDRDLERLVFDAEAGECSDEFRRITSSSSFEFGQGIHGRAWQQGDLVAIDNLADVQDSPRAQAARREGVVQGVCFPVFLRDDLIGTFEFFCYDHLSISQATLETMRLIQNIASSSVARAIAIAAITRAGADGRLVDGIMNAGAECDTALDVLARTADELRRGYELSGCVSWCIEGDELRAADVQGRAATSLARKST